MPTVRTVVLTLIAGVLAIVGTGVAGPVLAAQAVLTASAKGQYQQFSRTDRLPSSTGLRISIDSIGPARYASPNARITVSGTITNDTGARQDDVQVQLETSPANFTSQSLMDEFSTGGSDQLGIYPVGTTFVVPTVHSGSAARWSITVSAGTLGYQRFGVYPLAAQVLSGIGTPLGEARTFLPFWPGSGSGAGAPEKLDIAWIWPLVDKPQQGVCPQDLATNDLAASLAPGGRLDGLLAAGMRYSASSRLTWAVDPALLSDASVMTGRYKVGGNSLCHDTTAMPASAPASTWLQGLQAKAAAGDPMFVTPYADPDVAALAHAGLDRDIGQSYALGNAVAGKILGQSFGQGSPIAWPEGGVADASVLTSLALEEKASTTVLSDEQMPATSYVDDAVTRVSTGIGNPMTVLLASSQISDLLGSATTTSSASAQFAVTQGFLAQTAMILDQAPSSHRSVVIAPPSRWNPSAAEAATLLSLTSAPWLRPVKLASLSKPSSGVTHQALAGSKASRQELGPGYLANVGSAQQMASVYASLLDHPDPATLQSLHVAVAVTESVAWRGNASTGGRAALGKLEAYIEDREQKVHIVSGKRVILAGTSGATPVSVSNDLPDAAVQVLVHATVPPGSQLSIGNQDALLTIPANQTKTVRLQVHSAALGTAQLQLQLLTRNGAPLSGPPQPPLSVETTRFGRTLLILIAAALGVLVLASVARWIRRWLRDGGSGHHVSDGSASGDAVPHDGAITGDMAQDSASQSGGTG